MLRHLLEELRDMVVLKDGPIVVEHGQLGARLDVEVVRRARVVIVVDNGREQQGKHLLTIIQKSLNDK